MQSNPATFTALHEMEQEQEQERELVSFEANGRA